ncbi:hypothetical protein MgSA37_02462 [Mucilaginibacter gotjawali]|uniref:Uncharacterized protein n=1 Tax=Mucilaginibacter gotjawali TaxID=1550579 RepID=A0A0X8X367_9SPHI|nr:hypothetical protein MgSA37_02462 [Mucilaginibacter gotjawali]
MEHIYYHAMRYCKRDAHDGLASGVALEPVGLIAGTEPRLAFHSPFTIANDLSTWSVGEMWSVFDENTATILPSLPMTKVVRGIKP